MRMKKRGWWVGLTADIRTGFAWGTTGRLSGQFNPSLLTTDGVRLWRIDGIGLWRIDGVGLERLE